MPQYSYIAIDSSNARKQGQIEAQNKMDAINKLVASNLDVIQIKPARKPLFTLSSENRITRKELITITYQLEQLLSAGVPLIQVLESLQESFEKKVVKDLLASILSDMRESGKTFAEALESHADVFSPVYISLVRVGESTGQLPDVLSELAGMLKWEDELASKAKKIMIYPSIVITVVLGVVITLMIFLVPQLLGFIKEMGGEIGLATRALIATSDFVQEHILGILLTPFILVFVISYLRKHFIGFRRWFDCTMLKFPLLGEISYKLKLSRLTNSLAIMYGAGLSITESIKLARNVLNNLCLEEKLDVALNAIEHDGRAVPDAFRESGLFPLMAIYMLQAGEDSGRMDQALLNVSYFFDRDAKELIEKIEPAIEPILTLILAGLVLWIMMAVLAPIYDTISKIQF